MRKAFRLLLIGVRGCYIGLRAAGKLIAEHPVVEARTRFAIPTLVDDSNSKSSVNDIPEPLDDSFSMDQARRDGVARFLVLPVERALDIRLGKFSVESSRS